DRSSLRVATHSGPQPDPRMLARPPAPRFEFYTSEAGHHVFNREGAVLALSCYSGCSASSAESEDMEMPRSRMPLATGKRGSSKALPSSSSSPRVLTGTGPVRLRVII